MVKKIKKFLFPFFLSTICGSICGFLVYDIYASSLSDILISSKIYVVEAGEYESYDVMRVNSLASDYVYYEEDGVYRTIIGMTKNVDNIDKIKNSYPYSSIVSEYYTDDTDLEKLVLQYDGVLENCVSDEEVKRVILEFLGEFKDKENIKLTKYDGATMLG